MANQCEPFEVGCFDDTAAKVAAGDTQCPQEGENRNPARTRRRSRCRVYTSAHVAWCTLTPPPPPPIHTDVI